MLLDAWGTLFYPRVPLEQYYRARAAALWEKLSEHGVEVDREAVYDALIRERRMMDSVRRYSMREVRVEGEVVALLILLGVEPSERLVRELSRAYMRPYMELTEAAPGARDFLEELRAAGVGLALVSNTMDGLATRRLLWRLGLLGYFKVLALSDEVGYVKPHPRIFRYALLRLGVPPGRAVMVGDESADAEGARSLGIRAIGYAGFHELRFDADARVESYEELAQLLEGWGFPLGKG